MEKLKPVEQEILGVVKFLAKQGKSKDDIVEQIYSGYGVNGPSTSTILGWIHEVTESLEGKKPPPPQEEEGACSMTWENINPTDEDTSSGTDGDSETEGLDNAMTQQQIDYVITLISKDKSLTTTQIGKIVGVPDRIICLVLLRKWGFQKQDGKWSQ